MNRLRLLFDNFTLILIAVVIAATLLPAHGRGAVIFDWATTLAIALLFFLHGAKLSRSAVIAGATHWRLHLLVFACTFIMFPLIGLALKPVLEPLLGEALYIGVFYLCVLPGTVQSAIAFTAIARGNVSAAVCSASASSLIGIALTPLLLKALLDADAGASTASTMDAVTHTAALPGWPFPAPLDRRLDRPQPKLAGQCGPKFYSACGVYRVQRLGYRRAMANCTRQCLDYLDDNMLRPAGPGALRHDLAGAPLQLQPRR